MSSNVRIPSGSFDADHKKIKGDPKLDQTPRLRVIHALEDHAVQNILLSLIAFRILNALSIETFFQPDEYFQSLEPAWQLAFGPNSGSWITWEWKHQLRSAVHPALFAAFYKLASFISQACQLAPANHAELLIVTPKVVQAVIAALGDFYTWKLAQRTYGINDKKAWATLALTILNPWQWFCSTRTLSNCLETTLTVVALSRWPWEWLIPSDPKEQNSRETFIHTSSGKKVTSSLRVSLGCAAFASILRPTNLLIWICLTSSTLFRLPREEHGQTLGQALAQLPRVSNDQAKAFILTTVVCGFTVLSISIVIDRLYYLNWTFPPLRFLYFNLAQSLAVFYGRNDWHYYLSQGFPLLLTGFLPFAILGIWSAMRLEFGTSELHDRHDGNTSAIKFRLALVSLFVPMVLSLISHKEVRFIYPLLPAMHLLASSPFVDYFEPVLYLMARKSTGRTGSNFLKQILLMGLFLLNLAIAVFTTKYHQTAPLSVLSYLRNEHISTYLAQPPAIAQIATADTTMIVGFLMPCHSTPWRSHLVFPSIKAWALSCEPPVNLDPSARASYLDDADRFYADPKGFLRRTLGAPPKSRRVWGAQQPRHGLGISGSSMEVEKVGWDGMNGTKIWPEYLVFFEGLEGVLTDVLRKSTYVECWRGWNSFVHDDWRRRGDIVVWCERPS